MVIYSEKKDRHLSIYVKTFISNDGTIMNERKVVCPLYFIEHDNFTYIMLYDDKMQVIRDAFEYLNYTMKECPLTTRKSSAHALRFLYCYLSLSNCSDRMIDQSALDGLIAFLRGISCSTQGFAMQTIRSGDTVNTYLSIYRAYFKAREIPCEPLFRAHSVSTHVQIEGEDQEFQRYSYDNNVRTRGPAQAEVPKYISPDEFRHIYSLALKKNDITSQLVMHLMYGYGLRLGEVLGITMEDIKEQRIDGKLAPVIILRNRLSDQPFQYAKGLMHVITADDYRHDPEYKKSNAKIFITYDLYERLINYINDYHTKMMQKYPENYAKGIADIVSIRDAPETNHYVFLNQYGRCLSGQTFNYHLKEYYREAGIPLDYGIKKDNLSHRLRHGFAMFHAHFSKKPVTALALKDMMRHKSISSTMVYYNPTDADKLEMEREFQSELYLMIPELKEDFYADKPI